jgi:hypothetical protein
MVRSLCLRSRTLTNDEQIKHTFCVVITLTATTSRLMSLSKLCCMFSPMDPHYHALHDFSSVSIHSVDSFSSSPVAQVRELLLVVNRLASFLNSSVASSRQLVLGRQKAGSNNLMQSVSRNGLHINEVQQWAGAFTISHSVFTHR